MEIRYYFKSLQKITPIIQNQVLMTALQQMNQVYTQIAQNPNNAQAKAAAQQLSGYRSEIFKQIQLPENIELNSIDQRIYQELRISEFIGDAGKEYFNKLFLDSAANLGLIASGLQKAITTLSKAQQFIGIVAEFPTLKEFVETNDRALLNIEYTSKEIHYGMKDLPQISRTWNLNLIALARVAKTTDTNFQIEMIQKGSLVVVASTAYAVANAMLTLANKVLDLIKKVAEIKKIRAETEKIMAETEEKRIIIENFRKREVIEIQTESKRIAEEIMVEFSWKKDEQEYNEVHSQTTKAAERTINFIRENNELSVINEIPDQGELKITVTKKYEEVKEITRIVREIEGP